MLKSRPLIGITRDSGRLDEPPSATFTAYFQSVLRAGGEAMELPYCTLPHAIPEILDSLDGLLLTGGDDLNPALWGETWHPKAVPVDPRRQQFELELLKQAEVRGVPILGVCLGAQLMNVHRGGSLHQFLPDLPRRRPLEHRKVNGVLLRHGVVIERTSRLRQIIGREQLSVNTYHKQSINRIGRGLNVAARATDGIIEAVEDTSGELFLGVQWHPERISDEPEHLALFEHLVQRASHFAQKRRYATESASGRSCTPQRP